MIVPPTRLLADYTSPELMSLVSASSVIIQPIGAVEQHGPHLPLSTDLHVVDEYAKAVVREHGDALDLWLLPALPFSKSNEHAWAGGTVWLTPETVLSMFRDIGRSLSTLPARRIVFLNGHGGNTSLLNVICRELRLSHGFLTFLLHPSVPADHGGEGNSAEGGMGIHGGVQETSVMLHLRPDLVHMEHAVSNVPTWMNDNTHVRFGGSASFGWLSDDFGPSGVIGDATLATAEIGKQLFEDGVDILGKTLAEIARFDFPDRVVR